MARALTVVSATAALVASVVLLIQPSELLGIVVGVLVVVAMLSLGEAGE